jgi:hypothetical protein
VALTSSDPDACAALLREFLMNEAGVYPPMSSRSPMIEYLAPFTLADRETDYRVAREHFSKRTMLAQTRHAPSAADSITPDIKPVEAIN